MIWCDNYVEAEAADDNVAAQLLMLLTVTTNKCQCDLEMCKRDIVVLQSAKQPL